MYASTTRTFQANRLRERIRNSRTQAQAHEEIHRELIGLLTGTGDIRDETIYQQATDNQELAQEMWDDHNEAIAELKALS